METRRRVGTALVLAVVFHLVAIPTLAWLFTFRGEPPAAAPKTDVAFVRVPADQWDAARAGASAKSDPNAPTPPSGERAKVDEKKPEEKKPEPPGQVVKTSPGNGEEDPNARLAAETSNKVEKESLARDRAPGHKVTMPKETTTQPPMDAPPSEPTTEDGDGLVLGEAGEGEAAPGGQAGQKLEIPSVKPQDRLALKEDPKGRGGKASREATEELQGNSDRFRVEAGPGDGSNPAQPGGGGGSGPLRLVPSAAALDKIAGGAFSDHVEGVEEGDGTFLNTREWRYASFFNRIKDNVSHTWNPGKELRRRDPSGEIYAWKDRHTLLSITLREDGEIADVFVERSSGVDFLDQEAIAAFRRAQPFPNPPRGLVDEEGRIKFQFGFYLQVGRGGLRIFR